MKRRFWISVICLIVCACPVAAQDGVFPFSGVVKADKVNIRAGQNKNFEALGSLKQGDTIVVVGQSFNWYKIKLPDDAQAYVSRKLVQFLRDNTGEVSGSRVNIRARASLESAVIGQLTKGTLVKIVETSDEWYRIEPAEGIYGWVLTDLVEFQSGSIPSPKVVQLPSKNIYAQQREEQERRRAEEEKKRQELERQKVSLEGTLVMISAGAPGSEIRHQITAEDGQVFYLMGYRSILDGFLNHRVRVEGLPQGEPVSAHPVLLVTKVVLVL